MMVQRWAILRGIVPTLNQPCMASGSRSDTNAGLMLGQRRKRWPGITQHRASV